LRVVQDKKLITPPQSFVDIYIDSSRGCGMDLEIFEQKNNALRKDGEKKSDRLQMPVRGGPSRISLGYESTTKLVTRVTTQRWNFP
jgi:hypothetical protein